MKRALIIEASGDLWGSERALLDLLSAMPTLEVAVCCPPGRPLNAELKKRRIRTLPYFVHSLHTKARSRRIWASIGVLRACLEFRPDVIYLNQSGAYKVALLPAIMLNLPLVAHVRIFDDAAYLARQKPAAHRLRGLIAISSAVEYEICRLPELVEIPLHRIYDAYTPSLLSPPAKTGRRVACVGRLVRVKGQDVLVRALRVMASLGDDVECLIVGDGDRGFVQELHHIAAGAGIDHAIQWSGFVADILPLLQTAAVLACPSHREPLGRVIFEAWDAGVLPVVFAGSGGAAEIVAAADGGILYDRQEPESLARALREALELSSSETDRLVKNGRSWMAAHCSATVYGEAVSRILSNAAAAQLSARSIVKAS